MFNGPENNIDKKAQSENIPYQINQTNFFVDIDKLPLNFMDQNNNPDSLKRTNC